MIKFNYSNYKVSKIANVESFMTGKNENYLDSLPPKEEDLTKEQIRQIENITLDSNSHLRFKYFMKYPTYAYYSSYDLTRHIHYTNRDDNIIALSKLIDKGDKIIINTGLPDYYYQVVADRNCDFEADIILYVKDNLNHFSKFFQSWFQKKYGAYFSEVSSGKELMQKLIEYIKIPNSQNLVKINYAIQNDKEASRLAYQWLLELDPYARKIKKTLSNPVGRQCYNDALVENIENVFQSYIKGQDYIASENLDEIVSLICIHHKFGIDPAFILNGASVSYETLNNIYNLAKQGGKFYGKLHFIPAEMYFPDDIPHAKLNSSSLYLASDAGHYAEVGNDNKDFIMEKYDKYNFNITDKVLGYVNLNLYQKLEVAKEFATQKINDNEFMDLINNSIIETILDRASNDIFYIEKIGNVKLTEEDFLAKIDKDGKVSYNSFSETFDMNINFAKFIMEKLPVNIKNVYADRAPAWYLFMSGHFPCSTIIENIKRYVDSGYFTDLEKIKGLVKCNGNIPEVNEILNDVLREAEAKKNAVIKENMSSFMSSGNIKQNFISDFPEAVDHVKELVHQISYSASLSKEINDSRFNSIIEIIGKIPIYIVNASEYMKIFEDKSSTSPNNCNGYFTNRSIFNDDRAIVVYVDSFSGFDILKSLGVASFSELNYQVENTMWHELVHAVFYASYSRITKNEIGNLSDWMQDPEEVMAISYGNLPHIRKTLSSFFESIYPFPEDITAGYIRKLKSDIVNTFKWEFKGMTMPEAILELENKIPDFNEEVLEEISEKSKGEQISELTEMFTGFILGQYLKSKTENFYADLIGKNVEEINFDENNVEKEVIEEYVPYKKDKYILELETKQEYRNFLEKSMEIVEREFIADKRNNELRYFNERYKPFVNYDSKNEKIYFKNPSTIYDLLLMVFGPPATIFGVNLESYGVFKNYASSWLTNYLKDFVLKQRELAKGTFEPKSKPVTPSEAKETGEMMAEMSDEYGPNWMWVAKSKFNWYKFGKTK